MDLANFASPWFSLLQRVRSGKRVEKQEVIDLLNSGNPVVDEVKPFLIQVIEGGYKFKNGNKPNPTLPSSYGEKRMMAGMIKMVEEMLAGDHAKIEPQTYSWMNSFKDESGTGAAEAVKAGHLTPREGAEIIFSQMYCVSDRVIRNMKKEGK